MSGNLIRLISDFNIDSLAGYLKNSPACKQYEVEVSPYGQVYQTIGQPSQSWADIIWTTPERCLAHFYKAFQLEYVLHEDVLNDVDDFADALIGSCNGQYVFVTSWVLPPDYRGYGMLDWQEGLGLTHLLAKCNLRLAERLANQNTIFMLDAQNWQNGMAQPTSDKMWYAAKVPYVSAVFDRAATQISECISGIEGKSRRLIVLDLDNTLWGGVVGENGWQGLRLGGHDHLGEAFRDFQLSLKSLSNRGIQLALSSKNDESVAFDAIDNHPEMILKRSDFAAWRINWNDKAANIADMIDELNIGLASVVFIDDSPAERIRVADALPALYVPEWPKDPTAYVATLRALSCFETVAISKEDRRRKAMYVAQRLRREEKHNVGNSDVWLQKLETCITVNPISASNLPRVTQLFNKTNQLNLKTRRLSEKEITDWAEQTNHNMMAISVSDRFGDMGLVGIISMTANGDEGHLSDFILSCRVMGRKVEETLLHLAVSEMAGRGVKTMKIEYLPTLRNRPTLEVLENANLTKTKPHHFEVDIATGYGKPISVMLELAIAAI